MAPGSCNFAGTSTIAKTDPSYGSCVYPSSLKYYFYAYLFLKTRLHDVFVDFTESVNLVNFMSRILNVLKCISVPCVLDGWMIIQRLRFVAEDVGLGSSVVYVLCATTC
ncbi:unnamed protein product, partial [Brassica oleracea]